MVKFNLVKRTHGAFGLESGECFNKSRNVGKVTWIHVLGDIRINSGKADILNYSLNRISLEQTQVERISLRRGEVLASTIEHLASLSRTAVSILKLKLKLCELSIAKVKKKNNKDHSNA